jgi:large subunit ribosomal protein L13e
MSEAKPLIFKKDRRQRQGRGFSREEMKKAGMDSKRALKLKIPIDLRRRSLHEENVQSLKVLLENVKTEVKHAEKKKGKSKS